MEKRDIINRLYYLRAALSAISIERDCVEYYERIMVQESIRKRHLIFLLVSVAFLLASVIAFAVMRIVIGTWFSLYLLIPLATAIVSVILCVNASKKLTYRRNQINIIKEQAKTDHINVETLIKTKPVRLEVVERCKRFYMLLIQVFSSILDERDWKNIDIVIFQLETGRADSVKEALQLTDRELQTERIAESISQVGRGIRVNADLLLTTITKCNFDISNQLKTINRQNDGFMSNEQLSAALQIRANISCRDLSVDAHTFLFK